MVILGQLFGTTPQLLEHHPIEPWRFWDNVLEHHPNFWNTAPFWDNFLEHHPNFWNTTPSSRGDSGTTTPQLLEHHPIDATKRTPTGQGRSSSATFGTPPHRAQTAGVGHWRAEPTSLWSPQEIIMSAPLFDESRAARNNHVCQGQPTENQEPPFAASKTAHQGPILWGPPPPPPPPAGPIHRTSEPDLMQRVHPCDI